MNILVAYGSKRGGTAEIAMEIGETLRESGFQVDVLPAHAVHDVRKYSAVIVGGALYAGLWHHTAQRFVLRHARALRERQVWFFSSGPLDDSAQKSALPPAPQVEDLLHYVGASGHATFGGRLAANATGFLASAMAREHAGDWRNPAQHQAWARGIAQRLVSQPLQVSRPATAFARLPSRAAAVALCLAAGLPALFGGVALMTRPDGSLIGLPLRLLEHSPFRDFLVPGLLLFVFVGLANTWSAILLLRRSGTAPMVSVLSGSALAVWMLVQIAMLRSLHPLQAAYLALGIAIIAVSAQSIRRMFPAPAGGGHEPAHQH